MKKLIGVCVLAFGFSGMAVASGIQDYGTYMCQKAGIATQTESGDLNMEYYRAFPEVPVDGLRVTFKENLIQTFDLNGNFRSSSNQVPLDSQPLFLKKEPSGNYSGKVKSGESYWYIAGTTIDNGFYVGGGNMVDVYTDCHKVTD